MKSRNVNGAHGSLRNCGKSGVDQSSSPVTQPVTATFRLGVGQVLIYSCSKASQILLVCFQLSVRALAKRF